MAKATNKSDHMTSFHGDTITTTLNTLKALFPESWRGENDGKDRVNVFFTLETEEGKVFTIYDWKEYRPLAGDEPVEFHIGGHSRMTTMDAREELSALL